MAATLPDTKKIQIIELLAAGGITQGEIAKKVGTTPQTISALKKRKEFMEKVVQRSRELLKENLPDVYKSLTKESKKGKDRHIKLFLEHLEKLEEAKHSQTKLVFKWKAPGSSEEHEIEGVLTKEEDE